MPKYPASFFYNCQIFLSASPEFLTLPPHNYLPDSPFKAEYTNQTRFLAGTTIALVHDAHLSYTLFPRRST